MAYTPTTWIDGSTPINASNLNKIEQGVDVADQAAVDAAAAATAAQATADAAIPKALVDAKGDLIGATTDNTPARIPVGTDGQVLTVDLAQPLGLKYAAPAAGGADLSYDGDWVAGTYQDGDVVVKDGIAYLCVGGPTAVAPDIAPWGNAGLSLIGDELAYVEGATDFSIPVVAQASAATVLTLPPITFDGATPIYIEFAAPLLFTGAGSSHSIFNLWDGSTDLKALGQFQNPDLYTAVFVRRRLTPSAGVHTYSIRGYATSVAGTLLSAAAGPRLPYYARITRAVPSPPQFPVTPLTPPTYGTSLPASPTDGQEAILVDSVANPSYQWRFRYNAGSTSPYKWEFVGGADFVHYISTGETTATTGSFVDFATVGPRMIVPRAGDYDIDALVGVQHAQAPALVGFSSFKGTTVQGIGRTYSVPGSNYQGQIPQIAERWLALAAGDELRLRYVNYTAGTATFGSRVLRVRPVRVA